VRDIGGYINLDGKQIKQGMIYRSAKLDDITELGKYTLVNILGVKTDLDLRGDKATKPVSELNHIITACPWYTDSDNSIFMNEANKTEFANTVKVFADIDNYPIIFHCSLGRDRTGTLALVLEGLLGLDYNTLMMEYELSVFSYWGSYGATNYKTQMSKHIENTYNYIHDHYDGDTFAEEVENFLLDIGVTAEEIASIKNIMLEEV
jgi:protein-tyrosine phosphatase